MNFLLSLVLTLGVLIVVHEYGHYRVAKACGVKVLRFSIGFGKVIWRRQPRPDGTEFVISAIPFGGYVRMLGMLGDPDPIPPGQRDVAFLYKPLWQRAAIVAAGPIANLLLAVLLYATQHWIGIDEPKARFSAPVASSLAEQAGMRAGDWVQAWSVDGSEWHDVRSMTDLRWEVTQAVLRGEALHLMVTDGAGRAQRNLVLALDTLPAGDVDAKLMQSIGLGGPYRGDTPTIGSVVAGGPAALAGLRKGDAVLSVGDVPMRDVDHLLQTIRASTSDDSAPQRWRVQRGGQVLELEVRPMVVSDGERRVGRIQAAIGQLPEMVTVRYGPWEGITHAVTRTWEVSALTVRMLGRMLIGKASIKNISGPLTIGDYAMQSLQLGLAYYLGFLAVVSVSLGVLNLLPLPVLDGGHLMVFLFEAVTGHPPSETWLARLQRSGLVVVGMMIAIALINDAARYKEDVARLLGLH
jgi:regulator of sigma E protease